MLMLQNAQLMTPKRSKSWLENNIIIIYNIIPYYLGCKTIALFPILGHPKPYNEYKAMAL